LKGLRVSPDQACDIVIACAVLHNVATIHRGKRLPTTMVEEQWEDIDMAILEQMDGRRVGDLYRDTYFLYRDILELLFII